MLWFTDILEHEIAHWLTLIWAERHGLDFRSLPPFLIEGLAQYFTPEDWHWPGTRADQFYTRAQIVAAWAQHGSLSDVPRSLSHLVGENFVSFLLWNCNVRSFLCVINELVVCLKDWPSCLAEWEEEWRRYWLPKEIRPWAFADLRMILEGAYTATRLLAPLFPEAWNLMSDISTEDDVDRFWDRLSGLAPNPTAEGVARLRSLECIFRHAIRDESTLSEVRARLEALLSDLARHWEAGDWEAYAKAYLEAVLVLLGRAPVSP